MARNVVLKYTIPITPGEFSPVEFMISFTVINKTQFIESTGERAIFKKLVNIYVSDGVATA